MLLNQDDLQSILLTIRLASLVTGILLCVGTPIAWWLATTDSRLKGPVGAIVAMPLVLPPTVLGFYLLTLMGPRGPVGYVTAFLGMEQLPFSFPGIVIASVIYSLPFMVQPLQSAFAQIDRRLIEAAKTLRASPLDVFFTVVLPLARQGFLTAAVLTFAHTVGEFGVVLMVGGNIPGISRVVSIQIFDHVESTEYASAHRLAAVMLIFSFVILILIYSRRGQRSREQ